MKQANLYLLLLALLAISAAGCATLFGTKSHVLAISSEPEAATVFVNGEEKGKTPLRLGLKADRSYLIEFQKEGYKPVTRLVNTKVDAGWVILDVLGGLIPIVIDASTGNWNKLDQKSVNAILAKQNP
jgi:hypothetical protein